GRDRGVAGATDLRRHVDGGRRRRAEPEAPVGGRAPAPERRVGAQAAGVELAHRDAGPNAAADDPPGRGGARGRGVAAVPALAEVVLAPAEERAARPHRAGRVIAGVDGGPAAAAHHLHRRVAVAADAADAELPREVRAPAPEGLVVLDAALVRRAGGELGEVV